MSENLGLSVYSYLNEVEGNDLTHELATRIHIGMENPDPDFQRQKKKMLEVSSSGRIKRGMLVYAYRFFRNNLFDKFFGDVADGCLADLSGIGPEKRKEFFDEIVNQFLESENDLLSDLALKKVLRGELKYMLEVFEAAFSDLKVICMTEDVKREVEEVVEG